MDYFNFKQGRLFCEEVDVNEIAKKVGTPVYIYSYQTMVDHYRKIDEAFSSIPHMIFYSAKANANLAVMRTIINEGAGVDIVSQGELFIALQAGADPKKIAFAGVGKTHREIEYALEKNILFFTVESIPELHRLNSIAQQQGKVADFSLRINPDIDAETLNYITTGRAENKFGVDIHRALEAYETSLNLANVNPVGIHMHIGSQLTSTQPYIDAINKMIPLIHEIKNKGIDLKYFDIGGGFGVVYNDEEPPTAEEYGSEIIPLVENLQLTIILEPGRFILGNAGILVTQVQYIKENPTKKFVVVDAGMNDLIRPALYQTSHRIVSTLSGTEKNIVADIVGPVCESADRFASEIEIPEVKAGDFVAILTAGAYASVMSSSYNARPKAPEVLVKEDKFYIVRERQTYEKMIEGEKIPDFLK